MSDAVTNFIATLVVTTGVAASVNLLRIALTDWRRSDRHHQIAAKRRKKHADQRDQTPRRHALAAAGGFALLAAPMAAAGAPVEPPEPQPQAASTTAPQLPAEAPPAAEPKLVISTDRPSFSDSTGIQPLWHLNVETGITFTFRNRDDVETQTFNGPEILLRYGLIEDRLELRASTSGYAWSRTDDGTGAGFDSSNGWNDVILGLKLKLTDQDGALPRLAFEVQSSLGAGSDNTSSQMAEPTLKLLWSYDLGLSFGDDWKGFTVGGNANVSWPTTNGARFTQGQGSIYLSFPIIEGLAGFGEYYVLGPNDKGTDAAHSVDFGATYLLNERIQLDGRVGFGLNSEADNFYVGFGISFLF